MPRCVTPAGSGSLSNGSTYTSMQNSAPVCAASQRMQHTARQVQLSVLSSRSRTRSIAAVTASSSSGQPFGGSAQASARSSSQNGAGPAGGSRKRTGNSSSGGHGSQYQIQQHDGWVEPWITQDIPEDRLPRIPELRPASPPPPPLLPGASATEAEMAAADGAWRWLPHHPSRSEMWEIIQQEARSELDGEPSLSGFVHTNILMHGASGLGRALASLLANKLASRTLLPMQLAGLFAEAYRSDESLLEACTADLQAVRDRDPACSAYIQPLLFFKGFQALQAYRLAHWMWQSGRKALAVAVQNRMSEVFHVDIHPGASIGQGVLIDHATGVVVGETAVIGDGVSLLHRVTLGGSGVRDGKRHPTIGNGVLLGAAVTVLGPVIVGAAAKVGAGSVVTTDLPPACVAVGVPARVIKTNHVPSTDMDQCDDYIFDYII